MAGVVRPAVLSAVLRVCAGVSLDLTEHEAMLEVDQVSVVEPPGWTRLGVAAKELIEPGAIVTIHELYAYEPVSTPLMHVRSCEIDAHVAGDATDDD